MKKSILTFVVILVLTSVLSLAQRPTYVGAKKCKPCHAGEMYSSVYEKWQNAFHAKAYETLKEAGEEKNPKCLRCHTTGYDIGGYELGAPNAADFEGVQCESCHGAGSLYKKLDHMNDEQKAVENGLMIPVEALCTKCHNKNSPTFKGFDYEKYLGRIDHIYRGQKTQ